LRTIALAFLVLTLATRAFAGALEDARAAFEERDFDRACDCLRGIELDPESRRLLLTACLRAERFEAILDALEDVDVSELRDDELTGYASAEYQVPGENERALSLLDSLIARLPHFADWARARKVEVHLGMQDLTMAEGALEELLSNHSESPFSETPLLDYAGALFQSGRSDSTVKTLERWMTSLRGVDRASGLDLIARAHGRMGDIRNRDRTYRRLLLDFTDTYYGWKAIEFVEGHEYEKGMACYRRGKYEDAARWLNRAERRGDADRAAPYRLISLYRLQRYTELLDEFRSVKDRLRGELEQSVYFYCALACERLDRPSDAAEFLLRLIEMGDVYRGAYELSYLLMTGRNTHWGKRTYESARERLEGLRDPLLRFRIGLLDLMHHRPESAVLEFRRALQDTGFNRAQALFWLNKVTGDPAYLDSLSAEFPLSYYTLKRGIEPAFDSMPLRAWVRAYSSDGESSPDDEVRRGQLLAFLGNQRGAYSRVTAGPYDWMEAAHHMRSLGLDWGSLELADLLRKHAERHGEPLVRELVELWFPDAYLGLIQRIAHHLGVDPLLMLALVREESHFDPNAGSWAGALGLAQLMPATASTVGSALGARIRRDHLFRPKINLLLGATYLREVLDEFGDFHLALAAYNAGPHRVRRWKRELGEIDEDLFIEFIPFRETRNYVRRVLRGYFLYRTLRG
jgi:tetratricopeptide (TPR) repeat protein